MDEEKNEGLIEAKLNMFIELTSSSGQVSSVLVDNMTSASTELRDPESYDPIGKRQAAVFGTPHRASMFNE